MTRYASRPLRLWAAAQQAATDRQRKGSGGGGGAQPAAAAPAGRLRVADSGAELTIEAAQALA